MQLLAVDLADFRNLPRALVEPHPRFNVLQGDNGQGKTNFIEGVYLLSTLRSFRATRLEELVRFNDDPSAAPSAPRSARARARVLRHNLDRLYEVEITAPPPRESGPASPARKACRVDGKPVRSTADYFGGFNVVLFVPDDLRLPRGAPSGRRRFLDRAVWNAEPAYLKECQTYEKVLRSRNAVLRDGGPSHQVGTLLEVYDQQLAESGAVLVRRRRRYLAALAPLVTEAFERISRSGLRITADYETRTDAPDEVYIAALAARLVETRRRDLAQGFTTIGPHGDDIDLRLDGRPARLYASQGQLRALVLALKVAEIQHLVAVLDDAPILLLDDVSSELDPSRNAWFFEFLEAVRCQVFVTTTFAAHVPIVSERRDFRVSAGEIRLC